MKCRSASPVTVRLIAIPNSHSMHVSIKEIEAIEARILQARDEINHLQNTITLLNCDLEHITAMEQS